jgi:hypothetical protein
MYDLEHRLSFHSVGLEFLGFFCLRLSRRVFLVVAIDLL